MVERSPAYDALVVVSFGGPEGPGDVEPFLDQVLRGRSVPPERRAAVAAHYHHFGGRSPINDHTRALVAAVSAELSGAGIDLPVYWGNRNWHPFLAHTVAAMEADGVRRALAFVTSAYASYSGCHQYLEDIARARQQVGPGAPVIDKLRLFYNHPGFVRANAEALRSAWASLAARLRPGSSGSAGSSGSSSGSSRPSGSSSGAAHVVFTAHSIPVAMAATCDYQRQLSTTAGLVMAAAFDGTEAESRPSWSVAFQSRSGPPSVPWLEPDLGDHLRQLAEEGSAGVVVAPIGFVADHMEVVYDLDVEAQALAASLGLPMVRAATAGVHPAFVTMVRQLVEERLRPGTPKLALGDDGPYHDVCPADCCPPPPRLHSAPTASPATPSA